MNLGTTLMVFLVMFAFTVISLSMGMRRKKVRSYGLKNICLRYKLYRLGRFYHFIIYSFKEILFPQKIRVH